MSTEPNLPPIPPIVEKLQPETWPHWLKWLLFVPVFAVFIFYFRDIRVGNGYFGNTPQEVDLGIKARVDNYGRVTLIYLDNTERASDGLGFVVVSKEINDKSPDRLLPFKAFIEESDWPVVVFLNATGFDSTGEPIFIRRASDGKVLYDAGTSRRVAFSYAYPDGSFLVQHTDKTVVKVSLEDWVKKYMRLSVPPHPKELEKLTDEELHKAGYEKITLEEAKKRGLLDDKGQPVPFPRPRVADIMKEDK